MSASSTNVDHAHLPAEHERADPRRAVSVPCRRSTAAGARRRHRGRGADGEHRAISSPLVVTLARGEHGHRGDAATNAPSGAADRARGPGTTPPGEHAEADTGRPGAPAGRPRRACPPAGGHAQGTYANGGYAPTGVIARRCRRRYRPSGRQSAVTSRLEGEATRSRPGPGRRDGRPSAAIEGSARAAGCSAGSGR